MLAYDQKAYFRFRSFILIWFQEKESFLDSTFFVRNFTPVKIIFEYNYCKNYDFGPLPSRYHLQVIVTHGNTPSIIVTLPPLTILEVTLGNLEGRSGTVNDGGDDMGRDCHDDGLWVTPDKIGNGMVMGR